MVQMKDEAMAEKVAEGSAEMAWKKGILDL